MQIEISGKLNKDTSKVACYIMVQLTAHVSLSGLPVLTTLYKLILKSKLWILCFIKVVDFNKSIFVYIFLTFGQFHQKIGFIGQKLI